MSNPAPTETESHWIWNRISTENPFYLLSAACVIHSTGLSLSGELPLNVLLALVGGYLLLLAVIGVLIVRLWKVWDDARSIFLTLVLLMVELAICFDHSLSTHQPNSVAGLFGITALALLLAECLVYLARIRLPLIYRGPFYLQLALAMLAALIPYHFQDPLHVRWSIYSVSVLSGLSMLTLIPAVRSYRENVERADCPWRWPYHPWSLFVIVWVCLGFRIHLLTVSFDPVFELSFADSSGMLGISGGYLFVPMLLGISVLLLEAAVVHRHWFIHSLGLALPIVCIGLSAKPLVANAALNNFMSEYTNSLGSPVWLCTLLSASLYAVSWYRGLPFAWRCLVLTLLILTRVSWDTLNWSTRIPVNLWVLLVPAAILITMGLRKQNSRYLVEAAVWGILAFGSRGWLAGWELSTIDLELHLIALVVGVISLIYADESMEELKPLLWLFMVICSARMLHHSLLGIHPDSFATLYLLAMLTGAIVLNHFHPEDGFRYVAIFAGACAYCSGFLELGRYLSERVRWNGLKQFLIGLGLLHIGVLVSAWKGGFFKRFFPDEPMSEQQAAGEMIRAEPPQST